MKKIVLAHVEQVIEFDTDEERQQYIRLESSKGMKVIESYEGDKYNLVIRKPYNNNKMGI
ncbi:MAG: hypothetical protein PHR06_01265 [Candidatus Cloacimonetes bacterium]|nr:hypothetical protein [Candidatus Cloacimonadota bacterium]